MNREQLYALTSLSPSPARTEAQAICIASWRAAGLDVCSFNHPAELSRVAARYAVQFIQVSTTLSGHYIPINAMLDWAAAADAPVLIINSDIELRCAPWELQRVRRLAGGGLCYFIRYNHEGTRSRATREPYGIDAFLLHGRDVALFPRSSLSMGQPFWDYWIPYTMAANGRPLFCMDSPVALHRNHARQWSQESWYRSGLEFDRLTGFLGTDKSFGACQAMSHAARNLIEQKRTLLASAPMDIRQWVEHTFRDPGTKTFLELGAHVGSDTAWMASLPGVRLHAFEPDPRNHPPALPNVTLHRAAIADRDGTAPFILSMEGWGKLWTHSSSIKSPKNHLTRHPVTFDETIEVRTITLDTFCRSQGTEQIDFIWANVQGAEGEMIRGALQTFERTRYLFTEYSDDEMYENQATLADILELLPDFRVLELWPFEVLLENRGFRQGT